MEKFYKSNTKSQGKPSCAWTTCTGVMSGHAPNAVLQNAACLGLVFISAWHDATRVSHYHMKIKNETLQQGFWKVKMSFLKCYFNFNIY